MDDYDEFQSPEKDFGNDASGALSTLEKARRHQELQITRRIRQLQQLQEMELQARDRNSRREEREKLREELLEGERRRRQEQALTARRMADERRRENMLRAHEEELEAKRRASEKFMKVTERMKQLEDDKKREQERQRRVASAKARDRDRVKEEAEKRLKERMDALSKKEHEVEVGKQLQKERLAMQQELKRLEDMARQRHRQEAIERAQAELDHRRNLLALKQHERDEVTGEVLREKEDVKRMRAQIQQSKELEAKLRVNQRAAEEARARELLSKRISEKRERVTAMEGYKEAMLKEMLVLRQRIKREEEALKDMLDKARTSAELESITARLAATAVRATTPGRGLTPPRGATPPPARPRSAPRGPPGGLQQQSVPRSISPGPRPAWGAAPAPGTGTTPRAPPSRAGAPPPRGRTPERRSAADPTRRPSVSPRVSPAPPPGRSTAKAAAATNTAARNANGRPSAEGYDPDLLKMPESDMKTVRVMIAEEKVRDKEREALLADIVDPREKDRLLKIFRMERQSFRQLLELLLLRK